MQSRKGNDHDTFESNAAVKSGYYFNPTTMNCVPVQRDGERLPNEKGSWIAIPTVAALALTSPPRLPVRLVPPDDRLRPDGAGGWREGRGPLPRRRGRADRPRLRPRHGAPDRQGGHGEKKEGEVKAAPELEKLQKEIEEKRK